MKWDFTCKIPRRITSNNTLYYTKFTETKFLKIIALYSFPFLLEFFSFIHKPIVFTCFTHFSKCSVAHIIKLMLKGFNTIIIWIYLIHILINQHGVVINCRQENTKKSKKSKICSLFSNNLILIEIS